MRQAGCLFSSAGRVDVPPTAPEVGGGLQDITRPRRTSETQKKGWPFSSPLSLFLGSSFLQGDEPFSLTLPKCKARRAPPPWSLLVPSVLLTARAFSAPQPAGLPPSPFPLQPSPAHMPPSSRYFQALGLCRPLSSVLSLPLPLSSPYVSMSSKPSPSICLPPCPTALLHSSYHPSSTLSAVVQPCLPLAHVRVLQSVPQSPPPSSCPIQRPPPLPSPVGLCFRPHQARCSSCP